MISRYELLKGAARMKELTTRSGTILKLVVLFFVSSVSYGTSNEPMIFYDAHNGGNCAGCEWIAATGQITEGTAKRFESFMRARGQKGCHSLVIDSPGGLLIEGLKLGYAIRNHGCTTIVGRTVSIYDPDWPSHKDTAPGECYSACAYAFLGGERRWISEDDKYGVHQHFYAKAITAPLEKTLTSIDFSKSQFLTGLLVAYVIDMGADPRLVSFASMVDPRNNIKVLSRSELELFRITTDIEPNMEEWRLEPMQKGLVAEVMQPQDDSGATQQARLLCYASRPKLSLLQILIPVGDFGDQVMSEINITQRPLVLSFGKEVSIEEYDAKIVNLSGQKTLMIEFQAQDTLLNEMSKADRLTWMRDSSRANQSFFYGWFSMKKYASVYRFTSLNCI